MTNELAPGAKTAKMADVMASLDASIATAEAEIARLEGLGAAERATAELGDKTLRGLGFGHGASRLVARRHDGEVGFGGEGGEAALDAKQANAYGGGAYTMQEDLAGLWMDEKERLRMLLERRHELVGA